MKVIPVDCNYVERGFAAAYLLVEGGRAFFIECNTNHAIPFLLEALNREGVGQEAVEGLLITHVHLDHAGGAGRFLETFPNAVLYAHPKAARHAIDPSRLVASATAVYGEEFMRNLYGEILPCDSARVRALAPGEPIPFGSRGIETREVRGHANHHVAAFEPLTRTLFSGDSFGVSYPVLNASGRIILPSTSPTDFDGEAALETVDWMIGKDPERIALTHYGFVEQPEIAEAASMLKEGIRASLRICERIRSGEIPPEGVEGELWSALEVRCRNRGIPLTAETRRMLSVDMRVNAQGLVHASSR
jgi:glyoxylase-like metal-dependent hydrolase (beta-lactamase superfamily II)